MTTEAGGWLVVCETQRWRRERMAKMAAEHLRALIEKRAPGRTVLSLEEAASVPEGRLSQYLKQAKPLTRLPPWQRLVEIALIIGGGCTVTEVSEAILRDVYPKIINELLAVDLSDDERHLLTAYRGLPEADRPRAIDFVELRDDERTMLAAYRRVPEADRPRAIAMIEVLTR